MRSIATVWGRRGGSSLSTTLRPAKTRRQWYAMQQASAAASASDVQQQQPDQGTRLVLVVAVALIDQQQRVLLAQRPAGKAMAGLWEFPGGKVDAGETPEAALCRELQEELSIQVDANDLQPLTFASHTYDSFHLLMPLYACRAWAGQPQGVEGQQLAWVAPQQLREYQMPAADIPLIQPLLQAMGSTTPPPASLSSTDAA